MAKSKTAFKRPYKKRMYRKAKTGYKKPTGLFRKNVLSIIHGNTEDKAMTTTYDPSFLPTTLNAVSDLREILPDILIGANDHQRIGRQIKGKSLKIWGHLELNNSLALQVLEGNTRVAVRLLVISDKRVTNYDAVTTSFLNNLIDLGSSTQNIDGTIGGIQNLRSMYLPIDRNTATVHYDKLFYLHTPRLYNTAGAQLQDVDLGSTIKFFKMSIPCKKVLKYTDNSNSPTNFAPYLTGCCFLLNGNATSSTSQIVKLHFTTKFVWEDN